MRENDLLQDYVTPICLADMSAGKAVLRRLLGTAFFINDSGLFLTARHVLEGTVKDGTCKHLYGLIVKSQDEQPTSQFAKIQKWESASTPHDIAIGKVNFGSRSWFSVPRDFQQSPWKDIATLGYPETALNTAEGNFKIHVRALKGYVQRFVRQDEIELIRPHPDCYELNFPISKGMSGAPLFLTGSVNRQELIGVCVGSYTSEITDYHSRQILEDGKVFEERSVKSEQIGIAEAIFPLLKWKPEMLKNLSLGDLVHPHDLPGNI